MNRGERYKQQIDFHNLIIFFFFFSDNIMAYEKWGSNAVQKKKRKQPPPLSWIFLPKADIIESLLNIRSTCISIKICLFKILFKIQFCGECTAIEGINLSVYSTVLAIWFPLNSWVLTWKCSPKRRLRYRKCTVNHTWAAKRCFDLQSWICDFEQTGFHSFIINLSRIRRKNVTYPKEVCYYLWKKYSIVSLHFLIPIF